MINIYILQPLFWVRFFLFFFSLECSGLNKVSMISVLGKIKDVLGVIFVQKCVRVG